MKKALVFAVLVSSLSTYPLQASKLRVVSSSNPPSNNIWSFLAAGTAVAFLTAYFFRDRLPSWQQIANTFKSDPAEVQTPVQQRTAPDSSGNAGGGNAQQPSREGGLQPEREQQPVGRQEVQNGGAGNQHNDGGDAHSTAGGGGVPMTRQGGAATTRSRGVGKLPGGKGLRGGVFRTVVQPGSTGVAGSMTHPDASSAQQQQQQQQLGNAGTTPSSWVDGDCVVVDGDEEK